MKLLNKIIPIITCGIATIPMVPAISSCGDPESTQNELTLRILTHSYLSNKSSSGSEAFYFRLVGGSLYHYTMLKCSIQNVQYSSEQLSNVNVSCSFQFDNIEDGSFHTNVSWTSSFVGEIRSSSINFDITISYSDTNNYLSSTTQNVSIQMYR